MDAPRGEQVRCFCTERPLLAVVSIDERTREPIVHIKSWKGKRLYFEIVVVSGVVRVRCRSCLKWMTIKMNRGKPGLREFQGHPLNHLD